MASSATPAHLPAPREPDDRDQIGRKLQATLYELVSLALTGKQLQWVVVGPLFRSVRLQFNELVDSWRELADIVAERAVAVGFIPDGQAQAVAAESLMVPVPPEPIENRRAVWELTARIAEVSELVRVRMDALSDLDVVSQDVLIDVVRKLEEQHWMLRSQLVG